MSRRSRPAHPSTGANEGPAEVPLAEIARAKLLLTDELIKATQAEEKAAANR